MLLAGKATERGRWCCRVLSGPIGNHRSLKGVCIGQSQQKQPTDMNFIISYTHMLFKLVSFFLPPHFISFNFTWQSFPSTDKEGFRSFRIIKHWEKSKAMGFSSIVQHCTAAIWR